MSRPQTTSQRTAHWMRRSIAFSTRLPVALTLALALLVDACLLPETSSCRLTLAVRTTNCGAPFSVVRRDGALHCVSDPSEQVIGSGHLFVWDRDDWCFWAPLTRSLRADL